MLRLLEDQPPERSGRESRAREALRGWAAACADAAPGVVVAGWVA